MPEEFVPPKSNTPKIKIDAAPKDPPKEVLESTFSIEGMPKTDGVARVEFPDKIAAGDKKNEPASTDLPKLDPSEGKPIVPAKADEPKPEPKPDKSGDGKPADKEQPSFGILKPPTDKKSGSEGVDKKLAADVKSVNLPVKGEKVTRNYDGYSADEVNHFKQMSDSAYEFTTKLIKENKELSKLKDASFLQHPDAYTLTPDYREAVTNNQKLQREAAEFRKALILCEEGKKFIVPVGYDDNGNLKYSPEIEPTAEMKIELTGIVSNTQNAIQSNNAKLQNLGGTFKQRVDQDLQMIQKERVARFPWVREPKLMDYTVDCGPDVGEVSLKNIKDYFVSLVPPYFRSNPCTEVAADLFVALQIQGVEMAQLRAAKGITETKIEEAKRGEPSSEIKNGADTTPEVNGVKTFSLAGMPGK